MQSKHKQTKCEHSRRNLQITAFSVGITILNQIIIWKDDMKFLNEFPCLLGHPVFYIADGAMWPDTERVKILIMWYIRGHVTSYCTVIGGNSGHVK